MDLYKIIIICQILSYKVVLVLILLSYIGELVLYLLFNPLGNSMRKYYNYHLLFGKRELRLTETKIIVQVHTTLK